MNRIFGIVYLIAACAFCQEFNLKLRVSGFQVGELHVGCKACATEAYDSGQDIYVPPAAIQGGTIGLVLKDNPLRLYQDLRPVKFPQTWTVKCTVNGAASISWDREVLPEGLKFTIKRDNGSPIDMSRIDSIKLLKDTVLYITATKKIEPKKEQE